MHIRRIAPLATALALLAGCAATIDQGGLEQRTAQAVGRSVGQFARSAGGECNALLLAAGRC